VKRAPLADYRIVCFSTHGLGAGDVKGLAEPSLVLSIPREPSDFDDGLLTSSEVAQLRLNADWVVLFACNSIAGDKPGAEALSGRARSFLRRRAGPSGIALVGGFGSGNPPCHGNLRSHEIRSQTLRRRGVAPGDAGLSCRCNFAQKCISGILGAIRLDRGALPAEWHQLCIALV